MCFHAESDPALLGLFDFRSAYKSLVDVSKGFEFETSDSLSRNPPSIAPVRAIFCNDNWFTPPSQGNFLKTSKRSANSDLPLLE
ncbi:MAG: hypothetical protein EB133_06645 [Betaproteobacteria bacterium]|nr:hypothetical protein [Betaproteobacteria bacterium]